MNSDRKSNDQDKVNRIMELVGEIRAVFGKGGKEGNEEEFEEVRVET